MVSRDITVNKLTIPFLVSQIEYADTVFQLRGFTSVHELEPVARAIADDSITLVEIEDFPAQHLQVLHDLQGCAIGHL